MIRTKYILMLVLAFLMLQVSSSSAGDGAFSEVSLQCASPQASQKPVSHQPEFTQQEYALLAGTSSSAVSHSITPVVRTLNRSVRSNEQIRYCGRVVSAIDSTTTAERYGLYNHKILFVSHARYYYLCRLVRLII